MKQLILQCSLCFQWPVWRRVSPKRTHFGRTKDRFSHGKQFVNISLYLLFFHKHVTNKHLYISNQYSLFFQTPCWYDYTKRDHQFVGPNSYPIGVSPYPFSPTLGHPPVAVQWHRSATIDVFGGFTFKNEKITSSNPIYLDLKEICFMFGYHQLYRVHT